MQSLTQCRKPRKFAGKGSLVTLGNLEQPGSGDIGLHALATVAVRETEAETAVLRRAAG